jgi:hypothetical protein
MDYDVEIKIKFQRLTPVGRFGIWIVRIGAGLAGFKWQS